jgi:hypothetical protein
MLAMMLGFGLVFLLTGIGIVASSGLFVSTQAQLRADGREIVADVVDTQVVKTTRRGTVTDTRYEVKYRFQPPQQAVVSSGWEEVPQAVARTAAETRTIEVRYLPSDPSVNLPSASIGTESGPGFGSIWKMLVGGLFAVLGLGIFCLALKKPGAPGESAGRPVIPNAAR